MPYTPQKPNFQCSVCLIFFTKEKTIKTHKCRSAVCGYDGCEVRFRKNADLEEHQKVLIPTTHEGVFWHNHLINIYDSS